LIELIKIAQSTQSTQSTIFYGFKTAGKYTFDALTVVVVVVVAVTTWFNGGETTDVAVRVKVSDARGMSGASTWTETMDSV
jgi:hypothetical protein